MIPATLMYVDELRNTWKKTLAVTVAVGITAGIVNSGIANWKAIPERIAFNEIISFCVGSLFFFTGPITLSCTERLQPASRWAVRIVAAAINLNVGVLIGLAVLGVWVFFHGRYTERSPKTALCRRRFS